jgi:hypothetical protein
VAFKADVLALTGETTVAGARGVLAAWKTKADGYDKLASEKEAGEIAAFSAKIDETITQASKDLKVGFEPAAHAEIKAVALKLGGGKPTQDGVDYVVALVGSHAEDGRRRRAPRRSRRRPERPDRRREGSPEAPRPQGRGRRAGPDPRVGAPGVAGNAHLKRIT